MSLALGLHSFYSYLAKCSNMFRVIVRAKDDNIFIDAHKHEVLMRTRSKYTLLCTEMV